MSPEKLSPPERIMLLTIARESIERAVQRQALPKLNLDELPQALQEPGAAFVTLTRFGQLRGCIGTLEAYQPLVLDVREHAVAAATQDFRFSPVTLGELGQIEIEISRLTAPVPLDYDQPEDLPKHLRPGIDGVVLRDGFQRATFLPQVWEQLPEPVEFLDHLCLKMGARRNIWRQKVLEVQLYEVEEFREGNLDLV